MYYLSLVILIPFLCVPFNLVNPINPINNIFERIDRLEKLYWNYYVYCVGCWGILDDVFDCEKLSAW